MSKRQAQEKYPDIPSAEYNEGGSSSQALNTSGSSTHSSSSSTKLRKRKHGKVVKITDLESEFEDCDLDDAVALETKLRKVARNNSLSHEEMIKLLHKFVKNEHILALVTLKAEDELAREKEAAERRVFVTTDTPTVPKLTRAKARELNKTPVISLPSLSEPEPPEIASLIRDDLHSDEEDDEYMFQEEDFVSDDDPNTTASDLESNPRTPATPAAQTEPDDSPVKLTEDGCFKVPNERLLRETTAEDLRISTRTRSKLSLQETTIEDIQSEFIPPDIENIENGELHNLDEEWMQFLNDFTKPLNLSLVGDDDDPVNDPEYIAAEKVPVDAEELRDVNISKKELTELVAELFEGLVNEGISLESLELETPRKFLQNHLQETPDAPNTSEGIQEVCSQLEYYNKEEQEQSKVCLESEPQSTYISSTNNISAQPDYIYNPNVMSTPSTENSANREEIKPQDVDFIPVATPNTTTPCKTVSLPTSVNTHIELIAVPIPGQPNCFQLAKVMKATDPLPKLVPIQQYPQTTEHVPIKNHEQLEIPQLASKRAKQSRYTTPYDTNFKWEYVSVRRHVMAEYIQKFEHLKNAQDNKISSTTPEVAELTQNYSGFTPYQYDLLQQQLRIHVQLLTQTYVQTYCHPELWKLATKPKKMLLELQEKSQTNNFKIWNLEKAIQLTNDWEKELDQNTEENKKLMEFIHKEIDATSRNCRQIPKFHPRIMDVMLNSTVFMYPEYLPRMPFTQKNLTYEVFSPAESYLIAMGLEKHLKPILENKERLPNKSTPLSMACRRLSKDTIVGKRCRRVWDYMLLLKNADYYNPIKYFFEHNKAPPVEHQPIIGFENNTVKPPRERIQELPSVMKIYLEKKFDPLLPPKRSAPIKTPRPPRVKASEQARNSYIEFVKEAVGEDITLPDNYAEAAQPNQSATVNINPSANLVNKRKRVTDTSKVKSRAKRKPPQSLTINVNYVFGANVNAATALNSSAQAALPAPSHLSETICSHNLSQNLSIDANSTINEPENDSSILPLTPVLTYNFDLTTQSLQPTFNSTQNTENESISQTRITDFYEIKNTSTSSITSHWEDCQSEIIRKQTSSKQKAKRCIKSNSCRTYFHSSIKASIIQKAAKYREKLRLKKRCEDLITTYRLHLETLQLRYRHAPMVHHYYCKFKELELYSNLLNDLKMICAKNSQTPSSGATNSPNSLKRTEDNGTSTARITRKLNRQEENFRHMLLPDTPEEANRKDAIYAFNFYEKVEEAFKSSNRPDDCKKFNNILKSFDPKYDKVSDLYNKLEKLFLPDHPELAQVFLTFLLPSDAAEIGKFFEYFIINNMSTFINKLNIYFNKQPAQIRKIYNCLNDLAEDPDVTMKKLEAKILPLLKGNQFLIDWFMQQFPQNTPPERLFATPEHVINIKEQESNRTGAYVETITDLLDSDNQSQPCQLRYINGRIFYGSKMLLPAKLSFMASYYKDLSKSGKSIDIAATSSRCVHGIRDHGEKRLQSALETISSNSTNNETATNDDDRSEEDDASKVLIIDTTAEEDDSSSSIELCDESTLRSHAMRLNPNYYSSSCFPTNATSTPNPSVNTQLHHANAKKTSLNFNDEPKTSPRKNSQPNAMSSLINSPLSSASITSKEKRKSPSKKKSPLQPPITGKQPRGNLQPMVIIHETSSAINCAKRLKTLIDSEDQSTEDMVDSKEHLNIVAKPKPSICTSQSLSNPMEVKQEQSSDQEFLAETASLTPSPFPALRMDTDSNEEDAVSSSTPPNRVESDEECKLDIVATLSTNTEETAFTRNTLLTVTNSAWTRDEDKIILIEMKLGSHNREELYHRIADKLPQRTQYEITSRHIFLMDFLSKLQGK